MNVWITRTEPGASRLATVLAEHGHTSVCASVLDIERFDTRTGNDVDAVDVLVVLSEHALVGHEALCTGAKRVIAVGTATAAALGGGVRVEIPAEQSSEGVLSLFEHIDPCRVVVLTGVGGRQLLEPALGARGFEVRRIETYRRVAAAPPVGEVADAVRSCEVLEAASGDGVRHAATVWFGLGGPPDRPVLVPSSRVAAIAGERGFEQVITCAGASPEAVLAGLTEVGKSIGE